MADEKLTPAERVLQVIRRIPKGNVLTYGRVADRAGLPRRARFVAQVLRQNDDPTLCWHRVIGAGGRIAIPKDSPSHAVQVERLTADGVAVITGRVSLLRYAQKESDLPFLD